MKKAIPFIIGAVAVIGLLVAALVFRPLETTNQSMTTETPEASSTDQLEEMPTDSETPVASEGRYADYSEEAVAAEGYDETILFFHAAWCPECRAFEQAITDDDIPAGVQILKVDYDDSSELRQRYEVTIQSTFVKVNQEGDRVSLWVGYGRDKSLNAVLENT